MFRCAQGSRFRFSRGVCGLGHAVDGRDQHAGIREAHRARSAPCVRPFAECGTCFVTVRGMLERFFRRVLGIGAALSFLLCQRVASADPWEYEDPNEDPALTSRQSGLLPLRSTTPSPGGESWLSLVGFSQVSEVGPQSYGAMLALNLALERMAQKSATLSDSTSPPNATQSGPTHDVAPREPPSHQARGVVSPSNARACVAAAWLSAGLGADDSRLEAIVSRARWSALLPETSLRAMRYDDALSAVYTYIDSSRFRDSLSARVGLEARLTWRLHHLLYADDEPAFERIRLERQNARTRVAMRTLEALSHWQQAHVELRFATRGSREEAELGLRAAESEAALEVLTSGWFSAWRRANLDGLGSDKVGTESP